MTEARAASNGNGNKMDSRSQKELERIERQIGQLELVPGQDDDTRREIQALHARIDALRDERADGFDLVFLFLLGVGELEIDAALFGFVTNRLRFRRPPAAFGADLGEAYGFAFDVGTGY